MDCNYHFNLSSSLLLRILTQVAPHRGERLVEVGEREDEGLTRKMKIELSFLYIFCCDLFILFAFISLFTLYVNQEVDKFCIHVMKCQIYYLPQMSNLCCYLRS